MKTLNDFSIRGSHGQLTVASVDGTLLAYVPEVYRVNGEWITDSEYSNITRFDVNEYRARYGAIPDFVDILDIGYWFTNTDGTEGYEPPAEDWRQQYGSKNNEPV